MKFFFVAIIACLLLLTNCVKDEPTFTVEEIDGVKNIHNLTPKWGDKPKIELQFVQKIGSLDEEGENYQLHQMFEVTRDRDGNIYILDAGNFRVQKFSSSGSYLTTIGKQGQGPGEFSWPSTMGIVQSKILYVSDRGNNRITLFDLNGELLSDVRVGQDFIYSRVLHSGETVLQNSADSKIPDSEENRQVLLTLIDSSGKLVKKFGKVWKSEGLFSYYSRNIANIATDTDDNIYLSFWYDNRIEKYDAKGNLLLSIDRVLNLQPRQKKSAKSNWAVSFARSIGVDGEGRIWVPTFNRERYEGETSGEFRNKTDTMDFEVYDAAGVLLTRIPAMQSVYGFNVHDDRIYICDWTDASVTEYKIVEK